MRNAETEGCGETAFDSWAKLQYTRVVTDSRPGYAKRSPMNDCARDMTRTYTEAEVTAWIDEKLPTWSLARSYLTWTYTIRRGQPAPEDALEGAPKRWMQ